MSSLRVRNGRNLTMECYANQGLWAQGRRKVGASVLLVSYLVKLITQKRVAVTVTSLCMRVGKIIFQYSRATRKKSILR